MTIKIKNKNIILKKLKKSDYKHYYELSQNNDFVSKKKLYNLEEAKKQFIKIYFPANDKGNYTYKIIYTVTNKVIGLIELHSYNEINHTISLGYFIDNSYSNQGLTKISTKYLIEYIMKKHQYAAIYAKCYSDNIASKKILEYLNFKLDKITITSLKKEILSYKLERSFYNDSKTKRNL